MYFFNTVAKNIFNGDKNTMKKKIKLFIIALTFISITTTLHSLFLIQKTDKETIVNTSLQTNKIAYLTFDDGPSKNTDKILSILDKYNIKATFFVVGPSYTLKNEYLKKIVSSGHQIAIHSYTHNYDYIYASKENYLEDFYLCANWIKKITGYEPVLYRFPGGSSNTIANKSLIKEIINDLDKQGYVHADWNVDSLDSYVKNDTSKIISNSLTSLKRNENNNHYFQTVLLHDDVKKSATINALPSLIEKFIQYGYHFEPLTNKSHIIKHVK